MYEAYDMSKPISSEYFVTSNSFHMLLAGLSIGEAGKQRILSLNTEFCKKRGVPVSERSVIDVMRLAPLEPAGGHKCILDEVAHVRALSLKALGITDEFVKKYARILFLDYILSTALCYVEVFKDSRVDKFFATRNPAVARLITGADVAAPEAVTIQDYAAGMLTYIKLTPSSDAFKAVRPRGPMRFDMGVQVTPFPFVSCFLAGVRPLLQQSILKFTYLKDNGTLRELCTTLDADILNYYYKSPEVVEKMLRNSSMAWTRGFVRVPELGISRHDATGVRALNLARLVKIEVVDAIDASFIDINFDNIMQGFLRSIEALQRNDVVLIDIYKGIFGEEPPIRGTAEIIKYLSDWANIQQSMESTTFLRKLHSFMIQTPSYFESYLSIMNQPSVGRTSSGSRKRGASESDGDGSGLDDVF